MAMMDLDYLVGLDDEDDWDEEEYWDDEEDWEVRPVYRLIGTIDGRVAFPHGVEFNTFEEAQLFAESHDYDRGYRIEDDWTLENLAA